MAFAGVDIGAVGAKAVIMEDNEVLSFAILPTGANVVRASEKVLLNALNKAGLTRDAIEYVVATGYGRVSVPYANEKITEITCHARGAIWLLPNTKMVIDIGGQDSKVIRISEIGIIDNFNMNDKCAAGTGRFLEVMAHALELPIDEFGQLSLQSTNPCNISSICAVFAESEVVSLRAENIPAVDIIAGIHRAVAKRVVAMATPNGIRTPITMTGGVAKNIGMRKALESELGSKLQIPEEPQIVGALGAAIIAQNAKKLEKSRKSESNLCAA